nr:reverse transcriptase domain-containing protein [Tanacetum cinerariifolium]
MDRGSSNGFQKNKNIDRRIAYVNRTERKEELVIYLAVANEVVSAFLMMEKSEKQMPIYFVSRALQEHPEDDLLDTPMKNMKELPDPWIPFADGSSFIDSSGAGLIITNSEGMEFTYALRFRFHATNNEVDYKALIAGLRIAKQMGVKNMQGNVDFKLVANKANYVLREIREGSYSVYASPRSVVEKALRSGYYWLTMPFYKWGIDIAGPFLEGHGKVKFLIVATDYFTKWIEAKPVVTITGAKIKKFVWDNIVCRFSLLGEIISNNKKQFRDNPFKDWVRNTSFRPGDLVYQSNEASHGKEGGNLGPKWEGPYEVMEALGKGAYKLRDCNGSILPRTWNVCNLKK